MTRSESVAGQAVDEVLLRPATDATYTTASETELRRRMLEGDRYAKAELARRSQQESKPLPPHEQEALDRLKVELGAVEVAA